MDNSSFDSSSEDGEEYVPLWFFVTVNVLLCVITVVGNLLVIVAYIRDTRIRQTVAYTIILNLSVTDLLVGIFIFAPNTLWRVYDAWVLGPIPCKLWLVLDYSFFSVSTFTVVFISLDRYWLVSKGLAYNKFQTRQLVVVVLCSCWVISISFYVFIAFIAPVLSSHDSEFDSDDCELEVVQSTWFNIFEVVAMFMVPFLALVFLNGIVYQNILKRSKGLVATKHKLFGSIAEQTVDDTVADIPLTNVDTRATKRLMVSGYRGNASRKIEEESTMGQETHTADDKLTHDVNESQSIVSNKESPHVGDTSVRNATQTTANRPMSTATDINVFYLRKTAESRSSPTPLSSAVKLEPRNSMKTREKDERQKNQYRRDKNEFKRHRKAAITLAAIVVVYCLCCLPYFIYAIIVSFCKECVSDRVWETVAYLQWSKSTFNPFIYGFTNLLFRRNFAKFLFVDRICKKNGVGPVI